MVVMVVMMMMDDDDGDDDGGEEKSWARGSDEVPDEQMDDDVDYKTTIQFIKKQRNVFHSSMIDWKMQLATFCDLKYNGSKQHNHHHHHHCGPVFRSVALDLMLAMR